MKAFMSVAGLLGVLVVSGSAVAASAPNELIVRYRDPQNSAAQAMARNSALHVRDADVVSAPEGVVKLSFASAESADQARIKLEFSPDVENVSPNFLYKPALKVRLSEARRSHEPSPFLALPFAGLLATDLPEVDLPTQMVTPGVDPLAARDWALSSIAMPDAARMESALQGARPLIAAVIDTGIDYNHSDLTYAMWRNPDNAREIGYDFAHDSAKPYDVVKFDIEGCLKDIGCRLGIGQEKFLVNPGHGTHCAGHVGAVAGNSLGIRGVGSNVTQIMGLKFFYDAGEPKAGQGDDAGAVKSIDYAIKHGAKVISASWGGHMSREEAEKSELKPALERARAAGVLVVVAAGNETTDQDTDSEPGYPAAYDLDNLIVVAASDSQDKLADFSSYGAKSVHLAAPGVRILSTTAAGTGSPYNDLVGKITDSQGKVQEIGWDGTSMATPIVAGAVSAVWAKYPTEDYRQIRRRILDSVRKVPALKGKVSTGGVLNVSAALGL